MIDVYFYHDILTPHTVRFRWQQALAVPRVGDHIIGDFGYEGARVAWVVKQVEWIGNVQGRSATCYMTGPTGKAECTCPDIETTTWEERARGETSSLKGLEPKCEIHGGAR